MNEIYAILFSWATTLSGYSYPTMPNINFTSKDFFISEACSGNINCKVVGWYRGGNEVYVWDKLNIEYNQVAASIVVHEFVHFLQEKNGKPHITCKDLIELEREAYGVQKEYLLKNGVLANDVGLTTVTMSCEDK